MRYPLNENNLSTINFRFINNRTFLFYVYLNWYFDSNFGHNDRDLRTALTNPSLLSSPMTFPLASVINLTEVLFNIKKDAKHEKVSKHEFLIVTCEV